MLAHNLVGGVADDLLGSSVPAGDAAGGIEHENRIVDDTLDQDLEMAPRTVQRKIGLRQLPVQMLLRTQQARLGVLVGGHGGAEDQSRHRCADGNAQQQ